MDRDRIPRESRPFFWTGTSWSAWETSMPARHFSQLRFVQPPLRVASHDPGSSDWWTRFERHYSRPSTTVERRSAITPVQEQVDTSSDDSPSMDGKPSPAEHVGRKSSRSFNPVAAHSTALSASDRNAAGHTKRAAPLEDGSSFRLRRPKFGG